MAEDTTQDGVPTTGGITGPRSDTKDATSPPDNPETDQSAVEEGEEKLGYSEAGH
jgi:hypothetical protein